MARFKLISLLLCSLLAGCQGEQVQRSLEQGLAARLPDWRNQRPLAQTSPALFPLTTEAELNSALDRHVQTAELPGAVVALASSQRTWIRAAGRSSLSPSVDLEPTDRFRIGNLGEMFLAVICLQLAEEEVLSLKDPITEWLPPELTQQFPEAQKITVRQLLNHTSALPDLDPELLRQAVTADPDQRWTAPELLKLVSTQPVTRPRGGYTYSQTNYLLLQLIIERASGGSLAEAVQTRIAKPLELKNTYVELSATKTIAHAYQDWNQDGTREDVTQPLLNTGLGLGSKAIVSNAPDLLKFFQILFSSNQLITPAAREEMLTVVEMRRGGYGLGILNSMTRWGEMWGQADDSTPGFSAVIFYLPVHDLVVLVWTNTAGEPFNPSLELVERSLNIALGQTVRFSTGPTIQW
ncbi:MAG: serine hydrolase domain-containing protein [Elainella sp.]